MKKVIQCFPKSIVKDIKGHKLRYDNNCSYIIVGTIVLLFTFPFYKIIL